VALDPKKTATLSLDLQEGIFSFAPGAVACVPAAAATVAASRNAGIRVIHVGLGFEPGYPEISPKNARFSSLKEHGAFLKGSDSARIHADVFQEGDLVIHKHRVGAFSGNELSMVLRAQGVETLVLFGIATSGIVLSTVRAAFDLDFSCIVVKDACFDGDEEVHRVLTEKIFVGPATVVTAAEFQSDFARG
jgi:nicotinamidase-related amidase